MKASELRSKSVEELKTQLNDLQREQLNNRVLLKARQLKETDKLQKLRRDIARINTVLSEKTRAQSAQ